MQIFLKSDKSNVQENLVSTMNLQEICSKITPILAANLFDYVTKEKSESELKDELSRAYKQQDLKKFKRVLDQVLCPK